MKAGIDFGSKLAGTTTIAFRENHLLIIQSIDKGKDSDAWLLDKILHFKWKEIWIDAPLSLPGKYFGKGDSYHYRQADIDLKAMSPMFLGGLTARAVQLKDQLSAYEVQCFETYPSATLQRLKSASLYSKKQHPDIQLWEELEELLLLEIVTDKRRTHEFDAALAFYAAELFHQGKGLKCGNDAEGWIYY